MIDLMDKQVAKMDQCRMLVLDEADKLLSQDFKGMLDMVISRYVFLAASNLRISINEYPFLYLIYKYFFQVTQRTPNLAIFCHFSFKCQAIHGEALKGALWN